MRLSHLGVFHVLGFLVLSTTLQTTLQNVASADTGVSDERVSLPDGPGSIGGVGENISVDGNMGMMSYGIPIELPAGFLDATPSLRLAYSSGGGSGELGIGWGLSIASIERMTLRGLPEYTADDEFAAGGGEELVAVGVLDDTMVYRARDEREFVRYRWHDVGAGAAGYWTAELPNGAVSYFGADETGTLVNSAVVRTASGGVFRYMLVATVDSFDHVVRYTYTKDADGWPLVAEIGYLYGDGTTPRFSAHFSYEDRPDTVSTGEPGFVLALTQRLARVDVHSRSETIRSYILRYESTARSGGLSRLAEVEQLGRGGATYPVHFRFEYSRSLDGSCEGECRGPYVVDMGSLPGGVNLRNGRSTLLDINGDALPDILSTSLTGRHTFVMAEMHDGEVRYGAAVESSATLSDSAFILNAPGVQVLDVNGDGFTDIISSRTGEVLCNDGSGDWNGSACFMDSTLPVLEEDVSGDSNPRHVRFFDYDDDKRIDMIRTQLVETEVFVNTPAGFVRRVVEPIGVQFDESPTLQFSDLNGDGLQDPVEIDVSGDSLRTRTNLGFGRWTAWNTLGLSGFAPADVPLMQLEDLNGDGLADIVVVSGDRVRYAINRNGSFDTAETLSSAGVEGAIPSRELSTVVLFADMNGTGSRDIVWITDGAVTFLELFPIKPNLLSRIENGVGFVQDVEYGTSVLQQARDQDTENAWTFSLPQAMNLVVATDIWNRLSGGEEGVGLHTRREMLYRHGFYDGVDKTFRGYAEVEETLISDTVLDSQEGARTFRVFDVGSSDRYYNGLPVSTATFADRAGVWVPLRREDFEYDDCDVAGVPAAGLRLPVRHICETGRNTLVQEGAAESQWRTLRIETERDGYGQTVREERQGVVSTGGGACQACADDVSGPCGESCLGDELTTASSYIDPGASTGGAWQLGTVWRTESYATADGPRTETVSRYDGEDFIGLTEGTMTRGSLVVSQSRIRAGASDEAWVILTRNAVNSDGLVRETIGANGSVDILDNYRRRFSFDSEGLNVVRTDILLHGIDGEPHLLRREVSYESSFNLASENTAWMVFRDGTALTDRNATRYRYDSFARIIRRLETGDADATPTTEYSYALASPVSRIITRVRPELGGPTTFETIDCIDGEGRTVQTRTRIADGRYQVTGYTEYNRAGQAVRVYQGYESAGESCDTEPPSSWPFESYRYDGLGRTILVTQPDETLYGSASTSRTEFLPLLTLNFDVEDTAAGGEFEDTPTEVHTDGLGRVVSMVRNLSGERAIQRMHFDGLGRLVRIVDPEGNEKLQTYDLLGRVESTRDSDGGEWLYAYDSAGNLTELTDARGLSVITEYDAANRRLMTWDPSDEGSRVRYHYDYDGTCAECENGAAKLVALDYTLDVGTMEGVNAARDEFGFDSRGRRVFSARTLAGVRFETHHAFDNAGRLLRTDLPGEIAIRRTYDDGGRAIGLGDWLGIDYDERGEIASLEFANGASTTIGRDVLQRVRSFEMRLGASAIQGYGFERSRLGTITGIEDTSSAAPQGRPGLAANYGYDGWQRLVEAELTDQTIAYAYDRIDNIMSRTSTLESSAAHVGVYEYDSARPHAVVRAGGHAYRYDDAGYMVGRDELTLAYDHRGRLTSVTDGEGVETGRFLYGGGAERVAKLEDGGVVLYVTGELEIRDGIVNGFPRLGARRVSRIRSAAIQTQILSDVAPVGAPNEQINAADAWVAHAMSEGILSERTHSSAMHLLRGAARRLLLDASDSRVFLHQDPSGHLTLATNDAGDVVGEQLFYATGAVRYQRGFVDDRGFSGEELDSSTGLIAFDYRSFDPAIGRWTSVDPAFRNVNADSAARFGEAMSAYAYVANDPVNRIDPTGLVSLGGIGRAIGNAGRAIGGAVKSAARTVANGLSDFRERVRQGLQNRESADREANNFGSAVRRIRAKNRRQVRARERFVRRAQHRELMRDVRSNSNRPQIEGEGEAFVGPTPGDDRSNIFQIALGDDEGSGHQPVVLPPNRQPSESPEVEVRRVVEPSQPNDYSWDVSDDWDASYFEAVGDYY